MERTPRVALRTPERHDDFCGISLCAGVGGLDLGLHLAEPGYRTVCYVERNSFAASTLVARMADTSLAPAPVWDDLKSFDGRPWRGRVHIVTAGYPCQPFTLSGNRRGRDDPRHLWPYVARIIDEVRPEWCFFENVPGHLSLGFHDVARDLQGMGYRVAACVVSAAEVGGSHLRERMFILAHADLPDGRQQDEHPRGTGAVSVHRGPKPEGEPGRPDHGRPVLGHDVGPIEGHGLDARTARLFPPMPGDFAAWGAALQGGAASQPVLHRLDDGLALRVDRSAAAGNGVVPLAAARAWRWLRGCF
ncbi:DNA cytosine methyltransferase [Loktanella sp. DSM 29012]|uniref:DNA cytosine methyltransferase n=1 Tax=Loktanella sp. DSM 29012 TaxID=1881056 RepID=UPI000B7CE720|nr:DNA cytosine methyltransferase [Loktanella sp. DSM 29012]